MRGKVLLAEVDVRMGKVVVQEQVVAFYVRRVAWADGVVPSATLQTEHSDNTNVRVCVSERVSHWHCQRQKS